MKENKYTFFFRSWNVFSNWYKCEFEDENGLRFNCVEQYMMYAKSVLFGDIEMSRKIIESKYNPKLVKQLGRKVKNFDQYTWDCFKRSFVYNGCKMKFTQNEKLLTELLNSKGKLVESSPYDRVWGCGLSEDNPKIHDEKNWTGQNLLGEILTELRTNLQNEKTIK